MIKISGSAIASAGTIFVGDVDVVYKLSASGLASVFLNAADFATIGIAFNSAGALYAAERETNAIYAYTPSGVQGSFASVSSPYGVAVDSSGDVYTGAVGGGEIMKCTPEGAGSVFAASAGGV